MIKSINIKKTMLVSFAFILIIFAAFATTTSINANNACGDKDVITVSGDKNCINELYSGFGGTNIFNLKYVFEVTGISVGKDGGR